MKRTFDDAVILVPIGQHGASVGAHVVGDVDVPVNIVNSKRRQLIQKHADRFAVLDVGNWAKAYLI